VKEALGVCNWKKALGVCNWKACLLESGTY